MRNIGNKKGVVVIFVMIVLVALTGVALAFLYTVNSEIKFAGDELANTRAFYIAVAGLAKARYELTTGGQTVPYQETDVPFGKGTYSYTAVVASDPQNVNITSYGYVPDSANPVAQRMVAEENIAPGVGTNLSLGSIATAAGGNPSNAIDGNANSKWISSTDGTSSLTLKYDSAKTVGKAVVSGTKITSCVVQYSNNGSSWTNVSGASGGLPGTQTFTPVTAQFLRINVTGNKPQVNEFESYSGAAALDQGKFGTSL